MLKEFVGEFCMGRGDGISIANVVGNHLPKTNPGYNKCIEVHFGEDDNGIELWLKWKSSLVKIIVDTDKFKPGVLMETAVAVNYSDCILHEQTKTEIDKYVSEYNKMYAND